MDLRNLISALESAQTGTIAVANEHERDGNTNEVLFRIDQAAVSVTGGDVLQASYSPYTVAPEVIIEDLKQGRLSPGLLALAVVALLAIIALRRS